jgi:hypothetical protein
LGEVAAIQAIAQLGPVLGAPFAIKARIQAALAVAAILAQTIPAFFKGKDYTDKYEGPATWGEKQREVKIDKSGNVQVSPNRTTPLWVNRDDIITPSVNAFESKMNEPGSEIFKRVVGNKYAGDTKAHMRVVYVKGDNDDISDKLTETNRLLKKQLRKKTSFNPVIKLAHKKRFFGT